MSVFDLEKIKEELSVPDPLMPCIFKALRVIARLCEEGQKLEKQRGFLAEKLAYCCTASKCPTSWNESCPLSIECDMFGKVCMYAKPRDWEQAAEEAVR
jgi:hypothetical protein